MKLDSFIELYWNLKREHSMTLVKPGEERQDRAEMNAMNAILVLRGITHMHPADSVVVERAKKTGRHNFGSEISNEEA